MSNNIQLHKNDLPDDLNLGNIIAIDGEFMGLNVRRDPLCLIQISSGNSDAHIVQLNRETYNAPNLIRILSDEKIKKIFHFARSDLAHIKYYLKADVNNVECTKLQSKMASGQLNQDMLMKEATQMMGMLNPALQSMGLGGMGGGKGGKGMEGMGNLFSMMGGLMGGGGGKKKKHSKKK